MSLGFKKAGFKSIFATDVDKNAGKTFMRNFPETPFEVKDICQITKEEVDSITGGLVPKMYQTDNIYNLLKLDTATGKIDQVQWSLDSDNEGSVTINSESLTIYPRPGLFELYPTKNMYQFILLNKDNGWMWHVQWGLEYSKRWIRRIY